MASEGEGRVMENDMLGGIGKRPCRLRSGGGEPLDRAAIGDLLDWFARHRRQGLPWRKTALDGRRDPWRVWLAEIMLQQTTVATVAARFEEFLTRFPDVGALARAEVGEVMERWAGLGYYARARNLHRAARVIVDERGGKFPRSAAQWARLPGVGPYTAAAIAAIAFDEPVLPVDTNVARVLIRLHAIDRPWRDALAEIRRRARDFRPPPGIAGDLAEALMDLGSGPCVARGMPDCRVCPLAARCLSFAGGVAGDLPRRGERPARRKVAAVIFCLFGPDDEILLVRRPPHGLLGGMWGLPMSEPAPRDAFDPEALRARTRWRTLPLSPIAHTVRHLFTHLDLEAHVAWTRVTRPERLALRDGECWWSKDEARRVLPTLMRKALDKALLVART